MFWENGAKFLFIQGEDDQCVNPHALRCLMKKIPEEYHSKMEFIFYTGVGHLIKPPHAPLCRHNRNQMFKKELLWGGQEQPHAKAQ